MIEVFNAKGETLGYLNDTFIAETTSPTNDTFWIHNLAPYIDLIDESALSVTPLSQRNSRAKYALMTIHLEFKLGSEETIQKAASKKTSRNKKPDLSNGKFGVRIHYYSGRQSCYR